MSTWPVSFTSSLRAIIRGEVDSQTKKRALVTTAAVLGIATAALFVGLIVLFVFKSNMFSKDDGKKTG